MPVRKGATSRPKVEEKREAGSAETLNCKVSASFKG